MRRLWQYAGVYLALVVTPSSFAQTKSPEQPAPPAKVERPTDRLEHEARAAGPGSTVSSISIAKEALRVPHRLAMPTEFYPVLVPRIARAEDSFWRGSSPGVEESRIEHLVNRLADHLDLPEFAKTNTAQIRTLRMQLLTATPVFMGRGMASNHMKVGDRISSVLSPLQAMYLFQALIDQKFYNPAYQCTPEEWNNNSAYKGSFLMRPISAGYRVLPFSGQPKEASAANLTRRRQLEERVSSAISKMTMIEGLKTLKDVLDDLQIQ